MEREEQVRRGSAFTRASELRQKAGLEKGLMTRQANAVVRKALKQKKIDGVKLIAGTLDPDDEVEALCMRMVAGWKVERALRAVPGIGAVKSTSIIVTIGVSPNTTLGEMSWARRQELGRLVNASINGTL